MQEMDTLFLGQNSLGIGLSALRGTASLTTHLPLLPKTDIWLNLPHPVKLIRNGELSRRM